jgi:hypothetical protein
MALPVIPPNSIVRGPFLPEPVEVIITVPMGDSLKLIGRGLNTGMSYDPVLSPIQLTELEVSPEREPLDGNPDHFKLGIEAARLALAYEYDPFFSLSVARIDPLPHQLEAVYEYFVKLPRIRFLLADDPGAGKTIMAGLLLKELKARGLVKRTLIVTPANGSERCWTSSASISTSSVAMCYEPAMGKTPGRSEIRSLPPSPGSRASRTPTRA